MATMSELDRLFDADAAAAKQAWRDYDTATGSPGMSSLARQDAYYNEDPWERAAATRRASGLRAPEQRPPSRLPGIAASLAPGPLDYGLMLAGPAGAIGGRAAKIGAIGMGALFEPSEAQARVRQLVTGIGDMLGNVAGRKTLASPTEITRQFARSPQLIESMRNVANEPGYVLNPQRTFSPGIYKNPRVIAEEAAARVAPEHPAMKELFGVTREDLWNIGERGARKGNIEPQYKMPATVGGSYVAEGVMTPANARRIIDTLGEAQRFPQLIHGADAWYVMDPAFQRMVQLVGRDQAIKDYQRFNTVGSMFSPGSDVLTEINRGTAANMMIERGLWPQFLQYGGTAAEKRGADFPAALRDVAGHAYHSTAQAGPVNRYLQTGKVDMTKPKVPLYMQASGVPETGFQTRLPVPDAHFARGVGAADVRTTARPGISMTGPEYHQIGPWYREQVATPLGIEAVPAQARQWTVLAPQTGVETAIGAPKLELLSQRIWERAAEKGIDPQKLRDDVLMGKEHALWLIGAPTAAGMSGLARQDQYQPEE